MKITKLFEGVASSLGNACVLTSHIELILNSHVCSADATQCDTHYELVLGNMDQNQRMHIGTTLIDYLRGIYP